MATASVTRPSRVVETTVDCYEFWDRVFRRAGVLDYTEGLYDGDATLPYEEAQRRQIEYLLDAAGCAAGARLLDVGCGNGTLLDAARGRGVCGVGVTISPQQAAFCQARGLDARLTSYRDLGEEFTAGFDAVIANGSIEHFVQPREARDGSADDVYREMFAIFHRAIDPRSPVRRLVNTTIHFGRFRADPRLALRSAWAERWFSDRYHYASLVRGFGGFYPSPGQLERCAEDRFRLLAQRDATLDYHLTSEEWLRHGWRSLASARQWRRLAPFALRRPAHAARMMFLLLVAQSWNWQFRGAEAPMTHLWQTWERL